MAACNDGLTLEPHNPDLLTGRGNAWLDKGQVAAAMDDFQAALATNPKNRAAADGLRLARLKRKVKVTQCLQTDGRDGLKACDAALQKGTSDAFVIQKRRAELLHAMGREAEAIAAYQMAARLHPDDKQVHNALAALTLPEERPLPAKPAAAAAVGTQPPPASSVKRPPKAKKASAAAPIAAPKSSMATAAVAPEHARAASDPESRPLPGVESSAVETHSPPRIDLAPVRRYSNAPDAPGITH